MTPTAKTENYHWHKFNEFVFSESRIPVALPTNRDLLESIYIYGRKQKPSAVRPHTALELLQLHDTRM